MNLTPYAWVFNHEAKAPSIIVDFCNHKDANAIVRALDGHHWRGHKLQVDYRQLAIKQASTTIRQHPPPSRRWSKRPAYNDFESPDGAVTPPPWIGTSQLVSMSLQDSASSARALTFKPTYRWLQAPSKELDLNDPWVLEAYTRILMFRDDPRHLSDELQFPRTLSSQQRYTVHLLAQKLGTSSESVTVNGIERRITVRRRSPSYNGHSPIFWIFGHVLLVVAISSILSLIVSSNV